LGCAQWLAVTRNTVTHEVLTTELVAPQKAGRAATRKGGVK